MLASEVNVRVAYLRVSAVKRGAPEHELNDRLRVVVVGRSSGACALARAVGGIVEWNSKRRHPNLDDFPRVIEPPRRVRVDPRLIELAAPPVARVHKRLHHSDPRLAHAAVARPSDDGLGTTILEAVATGSILFAF
jgi:hypothetical protein